MTYYKALIIEDEKPAQIVLENYFKDFHEKFDVIGIVANIKDAIELINIERPHLLFLDINLGKEDGFDLLDKILPIKPRVIFTTAYDEFAIKAIKYEAENYLLKPIDPDEFDIAVKKVIQKLDAEHEKEDQIISFKHTKGIDRLRVNQIRYCKADGNYTTLYLEDGRALLLSKTLKKIQEVMPAHYFIRTHNAFLVNKLFIDKVDLYNKLRLKDGTLLSISRYRKKEVLFALKSL